MLQSMLLVGVGGFVGSALRYGINRLSVTYLSAGLPAGTLIVNLAGCLLIGIIAGLSQRSGAISPNTVLLLSTGFCGGFTTFSTFSLELLSMGSAGSLLMAAGYLAVSVAGGIFMVWLGRTIAA